MAQTALVSPKVPSDLLKWESNKKFTRETVSVTTIAATAIDIAESLAQPVKVNGAEYIMVAAADIANATALVLRTDSLVMVADANEDMVIINRYDAIINQDALPALDSAGAAINQTNFIAQLVALGFRMTSEAEKTNTQTT
jgi:hypothetical protein